DYRARIAEFVRSELMPLESEAGSYDAHENIRADLLDRLRAKAKARNLWALQMPSSLGGQGLSVVGMAVCYEAMNHSIFGPVVFNSAAPDDGNMILLNKVGTEAQKERWLKAIVQGVVRSAFGTTERHDWCSA